MGEMKKREKREIEGEKKEGRGELESDSERIQRRSQVRRFDKML